MPPVNVKPGRYPSNITASFSNNDSNTLKSENDSLRDTLDRLNKRDANLTNEIKENRSRIATLEVNYLNILTNNIVITNLPLFVIHRGI